MGLKFEYPPGATPLDPDDSAGLIPSHITTQGQLNEWEFANVAAGEDWAFSNVTKSMLTIDYAQQLHKRMFGDTWEWAGAIRTKGTLIGVAPEHIRVGLVDLFSDVEEQLKHRVWPLQQIAARYHHRLVLIHPFPNGNGRFSRTSADLLLARNGGQRFSWGANLGTAGDVRATYIAALQAADHSDYGPLFTYLGC